MSKLLTYINEKTNNAYMNLKLVSVVYSEDFNKITIKFVYDKNKPEITEVNKIEILTWVKSFLNENIEIELKFKKCLLDEDSVVENITNFIYKNYNSVFTAFDKKYVETEINDNNVYVKLGLAGILYQHLKNKNFEQQLVKNLNSNYFESFDVYIYEVLDYNLQQSLNEHIEVKSLEAIGSTVQNPNIFYDVENVVPIFGDLKETHVNAIANIMGAAQNVKIAGAVKFPNIREFKSKRKDENGEFVTKQFLSFTLQDSYGKIQCVFFPTKNDIDKIKEITQDQTIVVLGDAEIFNDKLNFKAKQISNCDVILEKKQEVVKLKSENENYVLVKPEKYLNLTQTNLFDVFENPVNSYLKQNTFVCFDLETTGFDASTCEIIEIGAVKIVNGKLSETFGCLVKPKQLISSEITGITGITNEMVNDACSIEQVLPDFYKFTRNAILVAHNINFDYNFINVAGNKIGYKFDNLQQDTLFLSRTYIKGIKNYKLKTVAESLGVSLENAHRAVHDAVAAAEIFIKLTDFMA